MTSNKCKYCSKLRPLTDHIHEVSILSHFYKNKSDITHSISEWLKLSFTLKSVSIEPWDYSANLMFTCRPAFEALMSDEKHFSEYTTHLTRFFYITNALEETYRLIKDNYKDSMNSTGAKRINNNSIKALMLLENMSEETTPNHFEHYCKSLSKLYEYYFNYFKPRKENLEINYPETHKCNGLNIIRKIRNDIAHGIFPINMNPEFNHDFAVVSNQTRLLVLATRMSAIYIQMFLLMYGENFDLDSYLDEISYTCWLEKMSTNENIKNIELDYYQRVPTINEIILNLHFKNSFSFNKFWGEYAY